MIVLADAPLPSKSCLTLSDQPFAHQFDQVQAASPTEEWDQEALTQYNALLVKEVLRM